MLRKPMNVMTDTLIDMLVAILMDDVALTTADAETVEQIQSELQRRREEETWGFLRCPLKDYFGGLSERLS